MNENKYGEPWSLNGKNFIVTNDCRTVKFAEGLTEDSERIVACVNALSGVEDPEAYLEDLRARAEHCPGVP